MPSETFFCPHCHRQLTKSAQAYILGEMGASGGRGIMMGSPAQTVTCPGCRFAIDADKMIRGDYDGTAGSMSTLASTVLFLAWIGSWFIISAYWDEPWWAGAIGGLVVGFLVGGLVDVMVKKLSKNH
jgi:hypothetical protein